MSFRRKGLTPEEIRAILDNTDSEDDIEISDVDSLGDPNFVPPVNESEASDTSEENDSYEDPNINNDQFQSITSISVPSTSFCDPSSSVSVPGPSFSVPNSSNLSVRISKKPDKKKEILWKKKNLVLNQQQLSFLGDSKLPPNILELDTPFRFFLFLFPTEIFEMIKNETNLYTNQKNPNSTFTISTLDMQQFVGIIYFMSVIHLPRVRSYWSSFIGIPIIQETMPYKKFEKLRESLHFNDNTQNLPVSNPDRDRIFKIRPLLEKINENLKKVPLEQYLCVDEQICSTKSRNFMKRYNPNKPHKWGYKIQVLSGASGFAYNIEPDSGKENVINLGEPNLGAASNNVMRLARIIPRHKNYRLFFDNYFTSIPLIVYLANEGILSVGTVRRNRIPNCKLPDDKEMKKKERGSSVEYCATVDGVDISTTSWKDNKLVHLASSFAGEEPKSVVRRYDKSSKTHIEIDRPFVVNEYNRHMGGVDLINSIMGRQKILLRSKRWQIRMFYHFLDLVMSNAWLLYKRVHAEAGKTEKLMNSADFRLEVAETLCKMNTKSKENKKRKSEVEEGLEEKKHKGPTQHMPPKPVRQDEIGHWPNWADKRIRCKYPKCKGFTQTICEKCGVGLCYNKSNNCFKNFHMN